ncbi:unnamed protein product [Porites lobata]|uniref:Uncharacterized protein n=1 Tax=Porites lobata TaxID=104759 RepID=A0ABN8NB36_9CNID|nr:unnamed protein product [Porites lobata]
MQYDGEIWREKFLSPCMSDARSVLDKELGNSGTEENSSNCEQNSSPSKKQRKRTKNKRLDGYETSQDDEPSKKKPKTSEGRKKAGGSKENDSESQNRKKNARKDHDDAAEKERKRIEKEQANKQREKERQALTERNNMLLERMTALVSNQSAEDPFDSDVVSECVDLTTSSTPPSNPVHRLQNTVNELRSATPERVLSISQLQKTLDMLQGNSEDPPTTPSICQTAIPSLQRTSLTTLQDVWEEPVSTTPVQQMPNSTTPVSRSPLTTLRGRLTEVPLSIPNQQKEATISGAQRTPLTNTPRNFPNRRQDLVARPTVGGKCPRRVLPQPLSSSDEEEYCPSCVTRKKRVRELEDQLKSLQGQVSDPPRPGKISPILAERFKMVELTPGSQVFVYQNHIHQAMARASYKSAASFLLNCFYTNDELVGMNLTGANGKKCPDKEILQKHYRICHERIPKAFAN